MYFVYPFVDGYLVCFHILAIFNNDARNLGVHVFIQGSELFPLDKKNCFARSYSSSIFFNFLKPVLSSVAADLIYVPTDSAQDFLSSTFSPTLDISCVMLEYPLYSNL